MHIDIPSFPQRTVVLSSRRDEDTVEAGRRNAAALQHAIDTTSAAGGGRVVVPEGFWACAPIVLKSGVDLHLESGALLSFIKDKDSYPLVATDYEGQPAIRCTAPISCDGADHVAITGKGVVDGGGDAWRPVKQWKVTDREWRRLTAHGVVVEGKERIWMPTASSRDGAFADIRGITPEALRQAAPYWDYYRPVLVELKRSRHVLLQGVTFLNSPAWAIHPWFCSEVLVDGIAVRNPYHAQNGDGIDVESCDGVEIRGSVFETGDDAICLKAGKGAAARRIPGPCRNVFVHDCTVYHGHGGFVIGSEMSRGVRDVLVERCLFLGTDTGIRIKSAMGRGGAVEQVVVRDVRMVDILHEAVTLTMGYVLNQVSGDEAPERGGAEDMPFFRDITMEGLRFLGQETRLKMEPIPGHPETIRGITVNGTRYDGAVLVP